MGWRATAGLAAALCLAVLYAWFDLRTDQTARSDGSVSWLPRPTPPSQGFERLVRFNPGDVTAIHLQRGAHDVRVIRSENGWEHVSRSQLLDDFLNNLRELGMIMALDVRPEQMKEYGLDPPAGVIELARSGQPSLVFLIGGHNPPATAAYVRLGRDGPVVLTGALLLWELDKALRAALEDPP